MRSLSFLSTAEISASGRPRCWWFRSAVMVSMAPLWCGWSLAKRDCRKPLFLRLISSKYCQRSGFSIDCPGRYRTGNFVLWSCVFCVLSTRTRPTNRDRGTPSLQFSGNSAARKVMQFSIAASRQAPTLHSSLRGTRRAGRRQARPWEWRPMRRRCLRPRNRAATRRGWQARAAGRGAS